MRTWDDYKQTMRETIWSVAKANDVEALKRFVSSTKDLDERDARGYSALMLAVYAGHDAATTMLLDAGANPNSADFGGNTVLMGAAFKGHLDLARTLIARGARVDAISDQGLSALDYARTFGRGDVVQYLEHLGTRPTASRPWAFIKILVGRFKRSGRAGSARP